MNHRCFFFSWKLYFKCLDDGREKALRGDGKLGKADDGRAVHNPYIHLTSFTRSKTGSKGDCHLAEIALDGSGYSEGPAPGNTNKSPGQSVNEHQGHEGGGYEMSRFSMPKTMKEGGRKLITEYCGGEYRTTVMSDT